MINVIEDRFIFPLLSICEFCHTNSALNAVESIKKLILHLFPAIDGFGLEVGLLVKSNAFEGLDELLHQPVSFSSSIIACFDEMCNVLFGVVLFVKLINLWRLISARHAKSVNPLCVRLCI